MTWQTGAQADSLGITGVYQLVQESAADKTWALNPGELATLMFDVNWGASADEDCDLQIVRGVDNGTAIQWETEDLAERLIIPVANKASIDPALKHFVVAGCDNFRIKARSRTPADLVGSNQGTVLVVQYRLDGVSL